MRVRHISDKEDLNNLNLIPAKKVKICYKPPISLI